MKGLRFICLIFLFYSSTNGVLGKSKPFFPTSLITDSLKENAVAVVRLEEIKIDVISLEQYNYSFRRVITILKPAGDEFGMFLEGYSKFIKLKNSELSVYNAEGEIIEVARQYSFKDYNISEASGTLFTDSRFLVYEYKEAKTYPYTVEIKYNIESKLTFSFPEWIPFPDYKVSVEENNYTLKTPISIPINYKNFFHQYLPTFSTNESYNIYNWTIKNAKAKEDEVFTDEEIPYTMICPTEFIIDGYKGSNKSWLDFGQWIYTLNSGREKLTSEVMYQLDQLTKGVSDLKEKARIVYDFLQKKTRYVSIQVGLGGWQPIESKEVCEKSYGDCKGLSLFTMSCLRHVGIDAKYVLVYAGDDPPVLTQDFTCNAFNHAIVCAPIDGDTLWFETTSQVAPFNYLGTFTDNRWVLLVDSAQSKLIKTPSGVNELMNVSTNMQFNSFGEFEINSHLKVKGEVFEEGSYFEKEATFDKNKWLRERMNIDAFHVISTDYLVNKSKHQLEMNIQLYHPNIKLTDNIYIPVKPYGQFSLPINLSKNRSHNITLQRPIIQTDTTEILIPDGYKLSFLPQFIDFKNQFGSYFSETILIENGKKLLLRRSFELHAGFYEANTFQSLMNLMKTARNGDRQELVLEKIK